MPRIPEDEIERIKREVAIERLVAARGIELRRSGANLIGRCPFHEDQEPSLVLTPAKNLWHCMGACQVGGSVIDWVMKAQGVSFRHAVEILRNGRLPAAPPSGGPPPRQSTVRTLPAPVTLEAGDEQLLLEVVDYYHRTLKESPEALAYLEERGLASPEAIDHFKLGYANRTLGLRLPVGNRQTGSAIRSRLQALGVMRESGHEHLTGSIVVPILDERGQVAQLYGRKITVKPPAPRHLYLPRAHRAVWNSAVLAGAEEVILCEALLDALSFWCAGFRQVTASYGVAGFTEAHLSLLVHEGIKRVLIAYDADEAGNQAAGELAARLAAAGIVAGRVRFPEGTDANEYACTHAPADQRLGALLEAARRNLASQAVSEVVPAQELSSLAAQAAQVAASQPPPLAAASASPGPPATAKPKIEGDQIVFEFAERRYRVRGLAKTPAGQLKVTVLASSGENLHADTIDLLASRSRATFIHEAAFEMGVKDEVVKKDLAQILGRLEELQDEEARKSQAPKAEAVAIPEREREEALALLRDPRLLERIGGDFERAGVVGERTNLLVGYLAAVSRKLDEPLAVLIQSSSAAGKTALADAVLDFVPEEERLKYSALTGQSLFYMGDRDLRHKVLAVVEEEGAERATYALKLLQSEGRLTIASTGKDPQTQKLVTQEYEVEGPVMLLLTTTAIDLDEELANRFLVLTVDEEREQTRAIHRRQRLSQTLEGLLAREERRSLLKLHQNAQRLLRPVLVANPYAPELTFLDDRTRTRRDHMKYLTLIQAIAFLHQYQRPVKTVERGGRHLRYIEVTPADIEEANALAHDVLGRSLDELAPQTRRMLMLVDQMVREAYQRDKIRREDYRFTRRELLRYSGWSYTQARVQLTKLCEMEYVIVHRGDRGHTYAYELAYDGQGKDGERFVMKLADVHAIQAPLGTTTMEGLPVENRALPATDPTVAGGLPPGNPGVAPGSPVAKTEANPHCPNDLEASVAENPENALGDQPESGRRTRTSSTLEAAR